VALGVGGPLHMPTFYRGGGVSLHPLQRSGQVPATSHMMAPMHAAPIGPDIQGHAPAAHFDMPNPPVLFGPGGPNDPKFMV